MLCEVSVLVSGVQREVLASGVVTRVSSAFSVQEKKRKREKQRRRRRRRRRGPGCLFSSESGPKLNYYDGQD